MNKYSHFVWSPTEEEEELRSLLGAGVNKVFVHRTS